MEPAIHRRLTIIIGSFAALGALVGVLAYFENKKQNAIKVELLVIEKHIAELDLAKKKKEALKS